MKNNRTKHPADKPEETEMFCNSPHCIAFGINPRTGKSCCTRNSGRVFR